MLAEGGVPFGTGACFRGFTGAPDAESEVVLTCGCAWGGCSCGVGDGEGLTAPAGPGLGDADGFAATVAAIGGCTVDAGEDTGGTIGGAGDDEFEPWCASFDGAAGAGFPDTVSLVAGAELGVETGGVTVEFG